MDLFDVRSLKTNVFLGMDRETGIELRSARCLGAGTRLNKTMREVARSTVVPRREDMAAKTDGDRADFPAPAGAAYRDAVGER